MTGRVSPVPPLRLAPTLPALLVALAGCLPHSVDEDPSPPTEVPDAFASTEGGEAPAQVDVPWWTSFEDRELDLLVRRALRDNLDLRAAWARLDQARARAVQAGAPYWPTVDLQLRGGRQRQFIPGIGTFDNDVFSASLPVSYEIDLFKRIGAQATAATLDAEATREDLETAAITISANVAEAWYDLLAARARRALLDEQIEVNEAFLELTLLRFQQGLTSAVDVHQQRVVVAATRGRLALVVAEEEAAANRLAVLLGEPPGTPVGSDRATLPTLTPVPDAGIPSELLADRPDLRAARLRVVAADWRVGAAIAARFPSLRLSGSVGFNSTSLSDLFQQVIWNLFGSVTQSVIDGGQRAAEVDRNRALLEEVVEGYGQAVLQALLEVENALVQERQIGAFVDAQEDRAESSRNALRESRVRYQQGLSDYLPVLTALTSSQNAELDLVDAERQRVARRIQLHRALGGTWTRDLPVPPRRRGPERDGADDDDSTGDGAGDEETSG